MTVRTRMAPSPTGEYHVGHLATLLKNYAFAKKHNGQFILRIEDTDRERLVEGAVEEIMSVIRDFGLDWDEGPDKGGPYGPYVQSKRLDIYQKYAQELVESGQAYYCFCTKERLAQSKEAMLANKQLPMYDRHCRGLSQAEVDARLAQATPFVIRLKVPDNQSVVFSDLIRGEISIESNNVDDQVLIKSDGFPTYHLAVVVDDHLMKISHIFRGEEWISSTPKHILLYRAFGWRLPIYAHIPVFLNPDGKGKMSKRKGTVSARSFLSDGYLSEALLNFFMILGWSRSDQREIMNLNEYIEEFDITKISPKSVVFDLKKLTWLNGIYLRKLSSLELIKRLEPFIPADFDRSKMADILPLISDRLEKLSDFESLSSFFYRPIKLDKQLFKVKQNEDSLIDQLRLTIAALSQLDSWTDKNIESAIRQLESDKQYQKSQFFMLLRVATTGRSATPPLFETMAVLGRDLTLSRLSDAIEVISSA